MDSCLLDYVGINTCADQVDPPSGIYINSLPGISLESIDKIATADQVSYAGVWKDVQNTAFIKFRVDFIAQLTKCFKLTKRCDYTDLLCDNKDVLLNAWLYCLGIQMMLFRITSNRLNRYTTIDRTIAQETLAMYQVEYESALAQSVQLIDVSACMCMEPGGQIARGWMTP